MAEIVGNDTDDFFKKNPDMKYVSAFAELVRAYDAEYVSKLMWAIHKVLDVDGPLFNEPIGFRMAEVAKNYLHDSDYDWTELEDAMEKYAEVTMNREQKVYYDYVKMYDMALVDSYAKAKDRNDFLKNGDKFATTIAKLREQYIIAKKNGRNVDTRGEANAGFFGRRAATRKIVRD